MHNMHCIYVTREMRVGGIIIFGMFEYLERGEYWINVGEIFDINWVNMCCGGYLIIIVVEGGIFGNI